MASKPELAEVVHAVVSDIKSGANQDAVNATAEAMFNLLAKQKVWQDQWASLATLLANSIAALPQDERAVMSLATLQLARDMVDEAAITLAEAPVMGTA